MSSRVCLQPDGVVPSAILLPRLDRLADKGGGVTARVIHASPWQPLVQVPERRPDSVVESRRILAREALEDQSIGLETPARMKCLKLAADRVMIFVTVQPEVEFADSFGHLDSCGPAVDGDR